MNAAAWPVLFAMTRAGIPDVVIHGAVAWASPDRILRSVGGELVCHGRSMLKPMMMKSLAPALTSRTSWAQRAISVASHGGTRVHVDAAQSLLAADVWHLLRVPSSLPLVPPGEPPPRDAAPSPWCHPCSGQHAAILRGCALLGWPSDTYTAQEHPFFDAFLRDARARLGASGPSLLAGDGCGLPTLALSIADHARLMASLAAHRDEDWIWEAMTKHADLIGGAGRLDTAILLACGGRVVAKEGADGLLGLAIVHDDFPAGLGVVIKLAHGWDPRAASLVAARILGELGFRVPAPAVEQPVVFAPALGA